MTLDPKSYFQISTSSGVPIYRQVMDQVKVHVATGRFKQDDFLPSVRQVARELEVNPMTISKAYSSLEKEGVLETVRGQGMRVISKVDSRQDVKGRKTELEPLLKEAIAKAKQLSLEKDMMIDLIQKFWKAAP